VRTSDSEAAMAPNLQVDDAALKTAQSTLTQAANRLEPLVRTLNGLDAQVVGADPLSTRLHGAHGNLADGIGILGQALTDLATYIGNAAISYGNTDTNLSTQLPRGAR
jgi:hypothetical protein